jgi:hypothetical protein
MTKLSAGTQAGTNKTIFRDKCYQQVVENEFYSNIEQIVFPESRKKTIH